MGVVYKAKQTERRPGRRHQDPARRPGPEQGIHQAVRARGQDRRQALAQQRRQRDRRRRGRRPLLLRDGIRRRADHQGFPRQEQDLRRERGPADRHWPSPRRSKHAHAARPDPSRHQARERDPDQGRRASSSPTSAWPGSPTTRSGGCPRPAWRSARPITSAPSRSAARPTSTSGPTSTASAPRSTTWSPAGSPTAARPPTR